VAMVKVMVRLKHLRRKRQPHELSLMSILLASLNFEHLTTACSTDLPGRGTAAAYGLGRPDPLRLPAQH